MSIVGRVGMAYAGAAEVLTTTTTTGARPAKGRTSPGTKRAVVVAVSLLALAALAALAVLIPASEASKDAEHYPYTSSSTGTTPDRSGSAVSQPVAPPMSEREALGAYAKLPLSFVPNEGQTNEAVRYYAQGAGYGFFFTKEGATLSFADGEGQGHALGFDFLGADPDVTLEARERLSGEVNYLVGDDPAKWRQGLPTHGGLLYGGLWPGIDMAVRGQGGNLKYEFHLQPGASVEDVRLAYRGAEGLSVGAGGELLVQTSLGVLKDAAPVSYQRIGGERVPVESRYTLAGDGGGYGFAVGAYDPRYPLVIDPGLAYSTFLGGMAVDYGNGIAVDGSGNAYVTGSTQSTEFPTTPGSFDTTFNAFEAAFVTKINASGSALDYSTFLGEASGERAHGIAVDGSGKAYVTGVTDSPEFPTTPGAFDTTFNGGTTAFVTKFNATGTALDYSTFLGAASGESIAVDGSGNAYVTGEIYSTEFPTTPGSFDTTPGALFETDAFVTKLNATGTALAYSTFLGGTTGPEGSADVGRGIAVQAGMAYVTGETDSSDFPTTSGAFDTTFNVDTDAFVTKINRAGSALAYSTFLGGASNDFGNGLAVREGNAYVTGSTTSRRYPTTRGAFDRAFNGGLGDAFVTKINRSGAALAYSTFVGGASSDGGTGIAVDGTGMAYVTGSTQSAKYPTTPGAFDTTLDGGQDAFVTKLSPG